jgi:hypothetical protein
MSLFTATSYPIFDIFLTMLYFFLFFIWIWLLVTVFMDIFRSRDIGGGVKALWVIFCIILPFLGVFIYLIARGGKMQDRAAGETAQQQQAFDLYVREVAGSGTDTATQLQKLVDLKSQGVLTEPEFELQKERALAGWGGASGVVKGQVCKCGKPSSTGMCEHAL